jgi:hypothetical protein
VEATLRLHVPAYLSVYAWKNVDVLIWENSPTVTLLASTGPLLEERVRESAGPVSVVHVVQSGLQLPDEATRSAIKEFSEKYNAAIANLVLVLELTGFQGSAIRGAFTGMLLLTRKRASTHVAKTLEEAASWLPEPHARATGVQIDRLELLSVLERARALHH